jgi:hypothetical protein
MSGEPALTDRAEMIAQLESDRYARKFPGGICVYCGVKEGDHYGLECPRDAQAEDRKKKLEAELMLNYGRLISTAREVKQKNTPEFMEYLKLCLNDHIDFFNKYNKEREVTR